jgi:hypothetical protein
MKDNNKHNRKADVFSLGCIYLEMIAAFRNVYPKDKSAWPLFGKGGRVYSENIGEFKQWLKTPKESTPATQHSYVQEAIIDLCIWQLSMTRSRGLTPITSTTNSVLLIIRRNPTIPSFAPNARKHDNILIPQFVLALE